MNSEINAIVIVHVSCEGPGLFAPVLRDCGADVRIIDVAQGDRLPERLDGTDMLIVMGGAMNVGEEDKYPYLRHEYVLLREAMAKDIPVLGVCLGSQLLAHAAGARVYRGPVGEFGWSLVEQTEAGREDPLFAGVDASMLVFQWHRYTFEVPSGGELIATSSVVPSQAIRVGRCAYGLQYHVELDRRLLDLWMEEAPKERDDLDAERIQRLVSTFNEHEDALDRQAETIARNFHQIARGR